MQSPYTEFVPANGTLPNDQTVIVTLYYKAPKSATINPSIGVWQGL